MGEVVTVTGTAAGSEPIDYAWNFGDGGTDTGNPASHTYAAFGDYAVTMTASNACGQESVQQTVTVAPLGAMHVEWIKLRVVYLGHWRFAIRGLVRVLDAGGGPVAGASVQAEWIPPSGRPKAQVSLTNPLGAASFKVLLNQLGTWKICITDVVLSGWVYDPDQNGETCDTVTIP